MAFVSPLTGISFFSALILTIALAILWEAFEKIIHVRESVQNILWDITLSIVAFVVTSFILLTYPPHPDDLFVVAAVVLILFAFTNISGWLAYRRRNRDFMH